MASYPDFVCIGAQKAATTWLYEVLRRTPGVFMPAIKELHYFSEHHCEDASRFGPRHRSEQIAYIRKYHQSKSRLTSFDERVQNQLHHLGASKTNDDWYRGIFAYAQDHEICGDICPCYMTMPARGIRHTMSINPLVRIIALVRDPVDRAWSHMRMHKKSGILNATTEELLSGQIPLGPYMRYTDYAGYLPLWESMSGQGRMLILPYDQIQSKPKQTVEQIFKFLGIAHADSRKKLNEVVFSGNQVELPLELREKLFNDLQPQYEYLHSLFPSIVDQWVESHRSQMCMSAQETV